MALETIITKAEKRLKSLAFTGLVGLALAGGAREAKADFIETGIILCQLVNALFI